MDTSHSNRNGEQVGPASRRRPIPARLFAAAIATAAVAACVAIASGSSPSEATAHADHGGQELKPSEQSAAMLATAAFQDVEVAEAAGWASTLDTLGCFQDHTQGGMGVHYLNASLMDDVVDIAKPEALVYELDFDGNIAGLVANEYIVPIEAWTSKQPPRLSGMNFHRHPVLPLWVLHTWLWRSNPAGVFADWNPAVRPCPSSVPIFGVDLPK